MQRNKLIPLLAIIGAGVLPSAHADQFLDNRWYAAPFASYIRAGGDRDSKDGFGGGLAVGKILNEQFNVELRGFYNGLNGKQGNWNLEGGTVDLQYYFTRNKFAPYAVLAAGGLNTCVSATCGAGILAEGGVGFTYEVHDNFLLRSDVRYRYNNNYHIQPGNTDYNDMVVNVGFVIPFGEKPKAVAKLDIPAPAPAPVVADCSTKDSDADGVNDCLDKCPNTLKGSKVDFNGCPVRLILKGQNFKHDSAELTPESKLILDEVAASLNSYPEKNEIEVQGHTSSEGSDAYNLKLSQKRANSVVAYLKSKAVTNKLTAKGFGESQPIADNKTEAGRSENRRVELIWITN
ncbi:OmpA family protein [Methylomonas paludis]|uniref:OmpA family protein n=1 Tax=Methylomonas paludis TaxID=1173101 RepID=A0A975MM24_9GAMM|nr:OmpA family protein [Methylomonas paludis]QWF69864.1 OmpA family protein [Methylomonas paludis]